MAQLYGFVRANLSSVDANIANIPSFPLQQNIGGVGTTTVNPNGSITPNYVFSTSSVIRIGATCTSASQSITLNIIFWDSNGNPYTSISVTFTSNSAADFGSNFQGVPSIDPWWVSGGATAVSVQVTAITGTWNVTGVFS